MNTKLKHNNKIKFLSPSKYLKEYNVEKIDKVCENHIDCKLNDGECSYMHGNCYHSIPITHTYCYEYYSSYCFKKNCPYNHYPGNKRFRKYNNVFYYNDEEEKIKDKNN